MHVFLRVVMRPARIHEASDAGSEAWLRLPPRQVGGVGQIVFSVMSGLELREKGRSDTRSEPAGKMDQIEGAFAAVTMPWRIACRHATGPRLSGRGRAKKWRASSLRQFSAPALRVANARIHHTPAQRQLPSRCGIRRSTHTSIEPAPDVGFFRIMRQVYGFADARPGSRSSRPAASTPRSPSPPVAGGGDDRGRHWY